MASFLVENEDEGHEEDVSLHECLKRVWRNERCAPTLLKYEESLIADISNHVWEQEQEIIHIRAEEQDGTTLFMAALLELEIDRMKFLLRSYHRCRLQKVQKFNQFWLSSSDRIDLMSPHELKFCKNYTDMMQAHYNACFLDKVPVPLRQLNEQQLTTEPPVDNHVFVRVLEDLGMVQMGDADEVELKEGEIAVVKYSNVDRLVENHKLELV